MSQLTHLYIKTHNITGLKYFGKTTTKDPFSYTGSGIYWCKHLKKHGRNFSTLIVASFNEEQKEEMIDFALSFSEIFDIVDSEEWANLISENGIGGGVSGDCVGVKNHFYGKKHTKETLEKISRSRKGKLCGADNHNFESERFKGSNNPMHGRRGINNPNFGIKKPSISKAHLGGRRITNGHKSKMVKPIDGVYTIPEGWYYPKDKRVDRRKGTGNTYNRKWVNDGEVRHLVVCGDGYVLPDGFIFGKKLKGMV